MLNPEICFRRWPLVVGMALLLVLAGCAGLPSTMPQLAPDADASAPNESTADPPPTGGAYVPPPTQPSMPTVEPSPLPTAKPTLQPGRVVSGWGDFPRRSVIAPAADGQTLALYLLEGNMAAELVTFEDKTIDADLITVVLSPDGQHVACLLQESLDGGTALEAVDVADPQRTLLYQPAWDPSLGGGKTNGSYTDWITSITWLDGEHILYAITKWYDYQACETLIVSGEPCPIPGEVWLVDLQGQNQLLLAADRVHSVVGSSSDGHHAYLLRFGSGWNPGAQFDWYGVAELDLATGAVNDLWPQGEDPNRYVNFRLTTGPGGERRILSTPARGDAAIWALDPLGGQAKAIWTLGAEEIPHGLALPEDFAWSPQAQQVFAYEIEGNVWRVDLSGAQSDRLTEGGYLLDWAPEGIVLERRVYDGGSVVGFTLQLLDEAGQVVGEIQF